MALRSPLGRRRALPGSALSASAVELPAVDVPLLWTPLVAGALACIGYIVHLVTGAGGETLGVVLLVGAYAGALLAGVAVAVWRRGGPGVLVSVAVAGYAVSSGSYALFVNAPDSFPSVYDIGLLAFYPLSSLALIAIVHRQIGELSAAAGSTPFSGRSRSPPSARRPSSRSWAGTSTPASRASSCTSSPTSCSSGSS